MSHLREEDFIPYLDGRLEETERARLDDHLAACADCRARAGELRAVMGVLDEWNAIEPSPAFDAAVRARLAEEIAVAAGKWYSLRPAFAGALAASVLLAVGLVLWQPAPSPKTPPEVAVTPEEAAPLAPVVSTEDAEGDLAALENEVLLENYELLKEFDILFEPVGEKEKEL